MQKILIVEDDEAQLELMAETLSIEGYDVEKASTCKDALQKIDAGFELALLDVNLPDGKGFEVLRQIKQKIPDTEVIMVTGERDVETAVRCLKMGAYDYLTKPFELDELIIITKRSLEHSELRRNKEAQELQLKEELKRMRKELQNSYLESVKILISIIEIRDHYLEGHAHKVAEMATAVALKMDLPRNVVDDVKIASFIHDIGKMDIPEAVLGKASKLTDAEMDKVKEHPVLSAKIASKFFNPEIIAYIRSHHERWDGSGYPDNLKAQDIPIGARIIAVADVYVAMRSDRPYRKALSKEETLEVIENNSGKLFDPKIVDAFIGLMKDK